MAILSTSTAVQLTYFDNFQALFPGQLYNASAVYSSAPFAFPAETSLIVGRGVVKGTVITPTATGFVDQMAPFTVKGVLAGSVEADFVGIAILNAVNNEAINNAAVNRTATEEAGYRQDVMADILKPGNQQQIAVIAKVAITQGQPVYMAVNSTNSDDVEVGEFSNGVGGTTGMIQLTALSWFQSSVAGTIGVIQL